MLPRRWALVVAATGPSCAGRPPPRPRPRLNASLCRRAGGCCCPAARRAVASTLATAPAPVALGEARCCCCCCCRAMSLRAAVGTKSRSRAAGAAPAPSGMRTQLRILSESSDDDVAVSQLDRNICIGRAETQLGFESKAAKVRLVRGKRYRYDRCAAHELRLDRLRLGDLAGAMREGRPSAGRLTPSRARAGGRHALQQPTFLNASQRHTVQSSAGEGDCAL